MGTDPKTSVLNQFQQSHDVKNLFVVDGSSHVRAACQNPTWTIMALCWRCCDYLADELKKGASCERRRRDHAPAGAGGHRGRGGSRDGGRAGAGAGKKAAAPAAGEVPLRPRARHPRRGRRADHPGRRAIGRRAPPSAPIYRCPPRREHRSALAAKRERRPRRDRRGFNRDVRPAVARRVACRAPEADGAHLAQRESPKENVDHLRHHQVVGGGSLYTSKIGIHDELQYQGNVYIDEFIGTDVSRKPERATAPSGDDTK